MKVSILRTGNEGNLILRFSRGGIEKLSNFDLNMNLNYSTIKKVCVRMLELVTKIPIFTTLEFLILRWQMSEIFTGKNFEFSNTNLKLHHWEEMAYQVTEYKY